MQEFIEDEVMIKMWPERFNPETLKKLHTRWMGHFKVLKRFGSNIMSLRFPKLGITLIQLKNLTRYHIPIDYPTVIPDISQFFQLHGHFWFIHIYLSRLLRFVSFYDASTTTKETSHQEDRGHFRGWNPVHYRMRIIAIPSSLEWKIQGRLHLITGWGDHAAQSKLT